MTQVRILWLLVGFAVAPAIPSLFLLGLSMARGGNEPLGNLLVVLIMSYAISAPVVVAIGVPALLLARRFGFDRWWFATILGGTCGGAFAFLFYSHSPPNIAIWQFVAWGGIVAAVVWLSWRLGAIHEARLTANNSFKPKR